MRQEQVHKLVLNQPITNDIEIKLVNTSKRICHWVGVNYVKNGGVVDHLAAVFKSEVLTQQFIECFEKVKNLKPVLSDTPQQQQTLLATNQLNFEPVLVEKQPQDITHSPPPVIQITPQTQRSSNAVEIFRADTKILEELSKFKSLSINSNGIIEVKATENFKKFCIQYAFKHISIKKVDSSFETFLQNHLQQFQLFNPTKSKQECMFALGHRYHELKLLPKGECF